MKLFLALLNIACNMNCTNGKTFPFFMLLLFCKSLEAKCIIIIIVMNNFLWSDWCSLSWSHWCSLSFAVCLEMFYYPTSELGICSQFIYRSNCSTLYGTCVWYLYNIYFMYCSCNSSESTRDSTVQPWAIYSIYSSIGTISYCSSPTEELNQFLKYFI